VKTVTDATNYRIEASPEVVEFWSRKRLPLSPRDWMAGALDELRTALNGLKPSPDEHLHAVYAGPDDGSGFDIENPLFYNVGNSHFRQLMARSVSFERWFQSPALQDGTTPNGFGVYQRYEPGALRDGFIGWKATELLASCGDVPVTSISRIDPVWLAIRRNAAPPARIGFLQPFIATIRVTDTGARPLLLSIAEPVKALLDGLICAYHAHDRDASVEVARMAAEGLGTTDELHVMLRDSAWGALGQRRLLWPRMQRWQWNPGDDLCVAAEVSMEHRPAPRAQQGLRWLLNGALWAAAPAA
jgi:hypothetical protein